MNNEPVAWMNVNGQFNKKETWIFHIPLYTHPAKTLDRELLDKTIIDQQNEIKELRKNLDVALMIINEPAKTLTDEEIEEVLYKLSMDSNLFDFARAILRKAQEK